MNAKLKKLAVILAIILVLSFIQTNIKITFSDDIGGKIDLFTQKEPYSGKGLNMSSDAFGPGENVTIYALVTYNDYPVQDLLVAFGILGPKNPIENITFYRAACTNKSGIATISFRIPYLNETTFGEWTVIGNTKIGDLLFQDLISFKVGWIVEIVSIKTINEEYLDQENFTRKSYVGVELVLRSIAMTEKKTTLTLTIYDSLDVRINSTEINNFTIQPDGVFVYSHYFLYIPENAHLGDAVIYACAYTTSEKLGGVPYCPEVSRNFLIINRDIAILSVQPSLTFVYKGEIVNVDVCVGNKGWEIESFNVQAYYNGTLIGIIPIFDLKPFSNATTRFVWNTSNVEDGLYLISASADPVPGEIDVSNNIFDDGFVEVKSPLHDIAVLNVTPSNTSVYVADIVDVYVTVKNQGKFTESFNVTTFYNSHIIQTLTVEHLEPNNKELLVFHWNVQNVTEGNYTLSALASSVLGEENLENNHYINGVVQVKVKPAPPLKIHDVAISKVSPYSNFTHIGEVLEIFVIVKNWGDSAESFNVTVFYNLHIVDTLFVKNLEPNTKKTLVFHWNTQNVAEGNYTLSAWASQVLGEENLENNHYVNGVVEVVAAPKRWFVPDWFYWLLLPLLILAVILLIAWYYSRRRRKKAEEAFYSGWTAWYYGYDMRNRI